MYQAILFDKDGTLTDFRATWQSWAVTLVRDLSAAAGVPLETLGGALGVDPVQGRLQADGPIVTSAFAETLAVMAAQTGWSVARLHEWLVARGAAPEPVVVGDPVAVFRSLRSRGMRLGVLTNDDRRGALRDLGSMGVLDQLDAIVACDDGHGVKPAPGGALAFARAVGVAPEAVLLVGDGGPDQAAAEGAGMDFVAVLTGTRGRGDYPAARAILDDVTHLNRWLDGLH